MIGLVSTRLIAGTLGGLTVMWLLCDVASAQPEGDSWFARSWRTDDGLPDNAVHSVAQTPDGYIWVTTDGGMARFDGANFKKFPVSNVVSNNALPAKVFVDSHQRFWIGMNRGAIIRLENNSSQV